MLLCLGQLKAPSLTWEGELLTELLLTPKSLAHPEQRLKGPIRRKASHHAPTHTLILPTRGRSAAAAWRLITNRVGGGIPLPSFILRSDP